MSTSQRAKRATEALDKFTCPTCKAEPGQLCRDRSRSYRRGQLMRGLHALRMNEARKAGY